MRRIKLGALLKTVAATIAVAAPAQAAPITIGNPLTQSSYFSVGFGGASTAANTSVPDPGASAASPVDGAVISWHLLLASGGPFELRVLRPAAGGYLGAGTSAPEVPLSTELQTFPANLPIKAGDLIGLDNASSTDKIGVVEVPGAAFSLWTPPLADGATQPPGETTPNGEIAFNAVVQPAPTLTAIAPHSGSIKGGASVTISGTDFANVSGVSFGGVPASSFSVGAEGQINAVAPHGKAGTVDVTVTTVAGTTAVTAADKFTYQACVVPKLKGKKLKAAKKKLRKAGCKLGKVKLRKGATNKTGKVVKQSRKAGKQLPPGTKVNVTLG